MNDDRFDWIALLDVLHASPFRVALVVSGGGSGAIAECFRHAGSSRTFVDACIPYSRKSMTQYLGSSPDGSSASGTTARQLAQQAYARARMLDDSETENQYAGIALVAALPTSEPRRGADRIHVALYTRDADTLWSLELETGSHTRESAEKVADDLLRVALIELTGDDSLPAPDVPSDLRVKRQEFS